MTIAAGFLYDGGVLLCADSEFTAGSSKLEGRKTGDFKASWGTVQVAFAGDVDYAASAFQRCERARDEPKMKKDPLTTLDDMLKEYYAGHVASEDDDYSLLFGIKLHRERVARFFSTRKTAFRELKSFEVAGSGEDAARDLLRFLYRDDPKLKLNYAISLASYILAHVKTHVQFCGGKSRILSLNHRGDITDHSLGKQAILLEQASCWFVCEAQKFMLGYSTGTATDFQKRLEILKGRALYIRQAWDSQKEEDLFKPSGLPPWPEELG